MASVGYDWHGQLAVNGKYTDSKWIMKRLIRVYIASASLAWQGQLFRDTHFILLLELQANGSLKLTIAQVLDNPINIFLMNSDIVLYCIFLKNICRYPTNN